MDWPLVTCAHNGTWNRGTNILCIESTLAYENEARIRKVIRRENPMGSSRNLGKLKVVGHGLQAVNSKRIRERALYPAT